MARHAAVRFVRRLHAGVLRRRLERNGVSRGEFLAGLSASLIPLPRWGGALPMRLRESPRIVLVGAGVAGLTCAYRLHQAGVTSSVYEANSRIGGRTWTLRGFFRDGQYAEHGGQLIASSQHAVRDLAAELGLELTDLNRLYPFDAADRYLVDGNPYSVDEAIDDYDRYVYAPLARDARAAGYPTTFYRHTAAGVALDRMSVDDWLDRNVPGGTSAKISVLLGIACKSEYGMETSVQSALNLIYLLAGERRGRLNLSGTGEDDRFTIAGGNDQLASVMASRLPAGTIATGMQLEALKKRTEGSYSCTFSSNGAARAVVADIVVLGIPFTVLRRVDLRGAAFSARKRAAIASLDLGSNAKVHLQFTSPYWFGEHSSGTAYGNTAFEDTWDTSIGQRGRAATIVCFLGGDAGARFTGPVHGMAPAAAARRYVASLEPVLPGAQHAFNGLAYQD
ncbi:MAG: FAD-dependent oxidoreductase, partial [Candidatus Eremiobacteraeota bacterium]|nr:FAD-dependent oxidoreductase [Candidatus Eremiobacteraeota bacterium]